MSVKDDFFKTLEECDSAEAYYFAQKIVKAIEKNRFRIYKDKKGNLTKLGLLAAALFEVLFCYGILKLKGGENDDGVS